jgi:hypothetical protein
LNPRPLVPQTSALPSCATARMVYDSIGESDPLPKQRAALLAIRDTDTEDRRAI